MEFKAKIYLAGPYTKPNPEVNLDITLKIADKLLDLGFAPFVPHLYYFWDKKYPRDYNFWLEFDKQFLSVCDAVLRLPGESYGSDKEEALAKELGIPVYLSIEELNNAYVCEGVV